MPNVHKMLNTTIKEKEKKEIFIAIFATNGKQILLKIMFFN